MTFRIALLTFALIFMATGASSQQRVGDIVVSLPWSRATPASAPVAGGYVEIRNEGAVADRLIGATFAAAGRVEIHEMAVTDGVMRMRPLSDGIVVPPRGTVILRPGGYHLMFMDLQRALHSGDRVVGTLVFERAGRVAVEFEVGPIGFAGPRQTR